MRVCADNAVAACNDALLGKERMLDTHIADIKIVCNALKFCKFPNLLAVFCRLNILVRCKVIHNKRNSCFIEYCFFVKLVHLVDSNRRSNIVSKHHIEICLYQLTRHNAVKPCVGSQYFLSHSHSHILTPIICKKYNY